MSVTLPPAVETEVVAAARATDGSPAAFDRVGVKYGLLWRDVAELVQKAGLLRRAPTNPLTGPSSPRVPLTKLCSGCGETKSKADFYAHPRTRDGLASQCATCNNRRQPTLSRMLRNRARNRAKEALVKAFPEEFERLLAAELATATREHQAVAAAAEARGQHDAPVARLKPGKKREGESVADRLDVARCTTCHTHHDAAHECPECGEATPEQPLKARPYVVRAWALAHSISVPQRGPIPARVLELYLEAHPAIDQEHAS